MNIQILSGENEIGGNKILVSHVLIQNLVNRCYFYVYGNRIFTYTTYGAVSRA